MKDPMYERDCATIYCPDPAKFVVKLHTRGDTLLGGDTLPLCQECASDWLRDALNAMLEGEGTIGITVMKP